MTFRSQGASVAAPVIVAHRHGNHLEMLNDIERLDVGMVEADVHLHRGRLEVRHLKTLGPVPVLWDTWRLANPFAPRLQLEDLLAAVGDQTHLMLDLKGRRSDMPAAVLEAIAGRERPGKTSVCARSWRLLDHFQDAPDVDTIYSVATMRQVERLLSRYEGVKLDGVSVHQRLLNADVARRLVELARLVMTWTINCVDRARTVLAWGITGLITDHPERLIAALQDGAAGASAGPRELLA